MVNCHICGGDLKEISSFSTLHQVTSDCRPWKLGGKLAVCESCFTVQKPASKDWNNDADEIYSGYEIYLQGGGLEQSTFDSTSGASLARSQKILSWLKEASLPRKGNLLDVGCGNGSFLKAFGASYPDWGMVGLELDDKNKKIIESIKGVKRLHIGNIETLEEKFDLIVLIHALEHITDPIKLLKSIISKLNPNGQLFIEVPDLASSPFDLLIADHCSHFTLSTLENVILNSGYKIQKLVADFVPKELSLLAFSANGDLQKEICIDISGEIIAKSNIDWMNSLLLKGKSCDGNIGIFGTSISATWLASSLGNKVDFFVDEDPNRIGRKHMGKNIFSIESAPEYSNILMPLRSDIANLVAKRLSENGCRFNFIF